MLSAGDDCVDSPCKHLTEDHDCYLTSFAWWQKVLIIISPCKLVYRWWWLSPCEHFDERWWLWCVPHFISTLTGDDDCVISLCEHLTGGDDCYNLISSHPVHADRGNYWFITPCKHVNKRWLCGQKLETVTSFKYLGSVITDEGSKPEILSRIAQTTAALTRLKPVWVDKVFLSAPRYDWCAPLSHRSSCMLVNHGPSQQSSKEKYKPLNWGTTARCYTSRTKTILPTRKSVPRSSRQLDHTKTSSLSIQTAVVWSCFPFIRSGQNHLARHNERGKKTRQTEEEVGRQHQGMDRPGVPQFPEGSGEHGKMEKTGCKIICGAPTTLAVKRLMIMMMTRRGIWHSGVINRIQVNLWFLKQW